MTKKTLLGILAIFTVFIGLIAAGTISAEKITNPDEVIYEDDYEYVLLWALEKDENIEVDVSVDSPAGAKIDVYIISDTEFSDYQTDGVFIPEIQHEDVSSASFKFKNPDGGTYYLVIDNKDNSRTSDAVPTGDVTVDYEYDDPFFATIEDLEEAAGFVAFTCIAAIVLGVVIIIMIIVVIIFLVTKKEKPPQQPAPYQQPPQAPYPGYQQPPPQQPYQQPPQQPIQEPPGQPPQEQPPQ
ncbi:MAG: hypothetical protein JSV09_16305 [Thermoplasmata archaeon]|nr:MAG: hypothetical protein JSV09_16305 [Thermoplasmata archaeon]